MTTGTRCEADRRREVPAPSEPGICHCHASQARKTGATIRRLRLPERNRQAWLRPAKGLEP